MGDVALFIAVGDALLMVGNTPLIVGEVVGKSLISAE